MIAIVLNLNAIIKTPNPCKKKSKNYKIWQSYTPGKIVKFWTPNLPNFCPIFEIIALNQSFDKGIKVLNDCNHQSNENVATLVIFVTAWFSSLHTALHTHERPLRQPKTRIKKQKVGHFGSLRTKGMGNYAFLYEFPTFSILCHPIKDISKKPCEFCPTFFQNST